MLFEGGKRSRKEEEQLELNRRILETAKARSKKEETEGYQIPDSYEEVDDEGNRIRKKEDLLTDRYEEEEVFHTEQEVWEETQVKMATSRFGAKDKRKKKTEEEDELVFDDQIDFISQQMLSGHHVSDEDVKEARKKMEEAKHLSIQEEGSSYLCTPIVNRCWKRFGTILSLSLKEKRDRAKRRRFHSICMRLGTRSWALLAVRSQDVSLR